MKKVHGGFTLVELMIVVAILGILLGFAVPTYSSYVKRAKVAEALQLTQEAKVALIAYHVRNGKFVSNTLSLDQRNKEIGLQARAEYESGNITKMWVGSNGVRGSSTSGHIAISLDPGLKVSTHGGQAMLLSTIELVGDTFQFVCSNSEAIWRSTVDHKYLPSSCKN